MPPDRAPKRALTPVFDEAGRLTDLRIATDGKSVSLAGRYGRRMEEDLAARALADAPKNPDGSPGDSPAALPVLLGFGMGHALRHLLENAPGPVAVVDREEDMLALTAGADLKSAPGVVFIGRAEAPDVESAMKALTGLLESTGRTAFAPVVHPVLRRLDPAFYGELAKRLAGHAAFWKAARPRRFASTTPRVLVFESDYFLAREINRAFSRMDAQVLSIPAPARDGDGGRFVEELLGICVRFRPDFILTVNHLGLDRQGALTALLEKLGLPLASWFVDNPHLILHDYQGLVSPWCMPFSWDEDLVASLKAMGFEHAAYLPLATDPAHFIPPAGPLPRVHPWRSRVSFVGASMRAQVDRLLDRLAPWPFARSEYQALAEAFRMRPERGAREFMRRTAPETYALWEALPTPEARLDFEMLVTWEATRRYRLEKIERLIPFTPLIAGDEGWKSSLAGEGEKWRAAGPLDYYADLPFFYCLAEINFNCTSMQMKGAVNQRVFDVPACGAFLLTDRRDQLGALFTPGREAISYDDPEEIGDLVRHYLARPEERKRIASAARERILSEHAYEHRLKTLCRAMRAAYGTS